VLFRSENDDLGSSASRRSTARWVAVGMLSTKDALADASFPVTFNDPHPDYGVTNLMRCDRIKVDAVGFKVMSVTANYSIPDDGGEHEPSEPSQTNPLVYSWATVQETVAIDRDREGNAIVASSGRPVLGLTQPRNYKRLTITRWESSFSVTTSLAYENTVNSDTFEGAVSGTVKCPIIQPSQSYTSLSTLIPIDYTFDFKAVIVWGVEPWQTQGIDEDSFAYATVDGAAVPMLITDASGNPFGSVRLNGSGSPVDTSKLFYIDPATEKAIASPAWVSVPTPTGATVVAAGVAKALRWNTLPAVSYASLGF